MKLKIDTNTMEGYRTFLAVKRLPTYRFVGHIAEFPDEYADRLFTDSRLTEVADYRPIDGLFDYQRDISRLAIQRRKFAVFAEPGLGKTLMMLEFARHAQQALGPTRRVLIILTAGAAGLTNPRLELFDSGQELVFDLALAPGQQLWIDFKAKTVKLNGTTSRSGSLRRPDSNWWAIPPGSHAVRFAGAGAATIEVRSRSAWVL